MLTTKLKLGPPSLLLGFATDPRLISSCWAANTVATRWVEVLERARVVRTSSSNLLKLTPAVVDKFEV